jgi:hypothetical protein
MSLCSLHHPVPSPRPASPAPCRYSDLSKCFCSNCDITIAVIPFSTRSTYVELCLLKALLRPPSLAPNRRLSLPCSNSPLAAYHHLRGPLLWKGVCACVCPTCFPFIARYTIVATTSTTVVPLQDNVPFRDVVGRGVYEYFRFDNPSSGSALSVSLTVLSGDADLTISLSVCVARHMCVCGCGCCV